VTVSGSVTLEPTFYVSASQIRVGQSLYSQSSATVTAGTSSIASVSNTQYSAFFMEYVLTSGSTSQRAGTIVSSWLGANNVFTETSTTDIGDTTPVNFSASLNGANANMNTLVTAGTWVIKTLTKAV
jgi:hypothetical protein